MCVFVDGSVAHSVVPLCVVIRELSPSFSPEFCFCCAGGSSCRRLLIVGWASRWTCIKLTKVRASAIHRHIKTKRSSLLRSHHTAIHAPMCCTGREERASAAKLIDHASLAVKLGSNIKDSREGRGGNKSIEKKWEGKWMPGPAGWNLPTEVNNFLVPPE